MSLTYLRVFRHIEEVARHGSIRKAAEHLFLTPSALDRRIHDIEAELGTPLFERHPRGMRPTPAGEVFLQHVRAQRADFERVRAEIEQIKGVQRGMVNLVASQALAHTLLPALIARFGRDHPGIVFSVSVADHALVPKALREFQADLGLVYHAPLAADITPLLEIPQPLYAVLAASHPLARRKSVTLADCLRHPVALPDPSLGGRHLLEAGFARADLAPRVVLESNSFEMLRNYVRHGEAITFQIELGALAPSSEGLAAVRVADPGLADGALVVAQLKNRPLPLPAQRFLEALRGVLTPDPPRAPRRRRGKHA